MRQYYLARHESLLQVEKGSVSASIPQNTIVMTDCCMVVQRFLLSQLGDAPPDLRQTVLDEYNTAPSTSSPCLSSLVLTKPGALPVNGPDAMIESQLPVQRVHAALQL